MKISNFIRLALVFSFFATALFAQGKEISRDDYLRPWKAAMDKTRTLNRRLVSKTDEFNDGKLTRTEEWQYEYDLPDKIHYVHIETFDGKTRRTEEIDIGQTKYCKRDEKPWETIDHSCIGGGTSGVPSVTSVRYSFEKVTLGNEDASLYSQYISYKNTFSPTADTEGPSFYESKFWLSKNGLFLRQEFTHGLNTPKKITRATVETYEYDPKLSIQAPIK